MLRKFIVPLAAAALMAGCMTAAPYGYRQGQSGDYYYGNPSVEYRHRGGYDYPGYGYPYYGPYRGGFHGSFSYGYPYRYPYGYGYYGNPYYGHPYYGYPYYRPIYRPRPGTNPTPDTRPDGGGWRNFDELRRRQGDGGVTTTPPPQPSFPTRQPREQTRRDDGGSRMSQMIQRAREGGRRVEQIEE